MLWLYIGGGAALAWWLGKRDEGVVAEGAGNMLTEAQKDTFVQLLPKHIKPYGSIITRVAFEEKVSPFLIVALGERESVWGTSPFLDVRSPAGRGDGGHGHGIMQIDDRFWSSWLRANDWTDPYTNVKKGAQILKQKMAILGGKSPIRASLPSGATQTISDGQYVYLSATQASRRNATAGKYEDPRPLVDAQLIRASIAAYNSGEASVLYSIVVGLDPDFTTAGGNYAQDVLSRAEVLEAQMQLA